MSTSLLGSTRHMSHTESWCSRHSYSTMLDISPILADDIPGRGQPSHFVSNISLRMLAKRCQLVITGRSSHAFPACDMLVSHGHTAFSLFPLIQHKREKVVWPHKTSDMLALHFKFN